MKDYRVRYFCPKGTKQNHAGIQREQDEKVAKGEAEWTPFFTGDTPTEYGDVEYLAVSIRSNNI